MTDLARTMTPDDQPAVEYLTRWKLVLETASDSRVLDAMWSCEIEQRRRAKIKFPPGILEELTRCVQSRIDQLSRSKES